MAKSKNKNKKSAGAPKAKFQVRRPGESLWEYFLRQVEGREKELREIEEKKALEASKLQLTKEEDVVTDDENFDKIHAQAILFASLGVNSEVAKTLRRAKGKLKNMSESSISNIMDYYEHYEEYTTLTEKGYIANVKDHNKNVNAALGEVDFVVNRIKVSRASDKLKENISIDALHKADAIYDALKALVKHQSYNLYMEANGIEIQFDMRYNSDYIQLKKDITTMLAYGCTHGGEALIAATIPAYKMEREVQHFVYFTMGENEIKEYTEEENKAKYLEFNDLEELDAKVDYVFTPFTKYLDSYGISIDSAEEDI